MIERKPSRVERTVMLLKADCRFLANFYVAWQSRAGNLENFFVHKNDAFLVSLSEYRKLRNCVKSDFIHCLQNLQEPSLRPPDVQSTVVDLALLVHSNYPEKKMKMYGAYCKEQIIEKISYASKTVERIDVLFDVYKEISFKQKTRERRSKGNILRPLLHHDTPIQHLKFQKFLQVNENKIELFGLIADCVVEQCTEPDVIVTKFEKR